ncbi:MAG: repeat containing protein [Bryobacterales bacterium]|nr:repeat containing protein [Bryobacterales bacterium]
MSRIPSAFLSGVVAAFLPVVCVAQTQQGYTISTVAGNGTNGFTGDGSSPTAAELGGPFQVAVDSSGAIYIADQLNNRIRKVAGGSISTVAGSSTNAYAGDGGSATKAALSHPQGVAVDSSGNIYIADTSNYVIRKVGTNGNISTIAGQQAGGSGSGYGGDGGPGTSAFLSHPVGMAFDAAGNLYIADSTNNLIRMLTPGGTITSVAGSFNFGFSGDGGLATSARLNNPDAVAIDRAGNLYIADAGNNRIRKVTAATGIITTIAGTSTFGFSGDGGPAVSAKLNAPRGVAVDGAGNVYIADFFNHRVRVVGTNGIISTVAGTGVAGYSGDGGASSAAQLNGPSDVTVGPNGTLYVTDNQNNVIRQLTAVSGLPGIADGGVVSAAAFGGSTSVAPGGWIEIYGSLLAVNTRGWAGADFSGVSAPTSLDGTSVTIGGVPAYVDYISPAQVNAQVPFNVGTGPQSVSVTTPVGTTAMYTVNVNATQPGLDAPPAFNLGGKQYVVALFSDGATYVLPPGFISGVTSRQAKPGDTITFYGVGFGPVTPNIPAGQTVQQINALVAPVQISFAQVPATLSYAGLAPGAIGLYQFNLVVPNIADSDSVPLTFAQAGATFTQTLYTAVHN